MQPTLTLIDASGYIFRAYHAIQHLSTSRGVPTNAVYGFTRMLLKTLREMEPTHIALAFDKDSRLGRQAIDPTYKANRDAPPSDLVPQFALIRKVVEVLNLPVVEVAGWEADDVIGTLARQAKEQHLKVLVVTGDKDFVQIVDEDVRLYDPMHDRHTTPAEVKERLGITPNQMRDYLALVGDAIDNVAKVPGIGPKTATDLIAQFGDVETLLERLDEVKKPKLREAIRAHQDVLRRGKQLVAFKTDLPITLDLEHFKRREIHEEQARSLFSELEFYRLLQEMPANAPTPLVTQTDILENVEALSGFLDEAREQKGVALIPAFDGVPHAGELVGLGLALPGGGSAYLPLHQRSTLGVSGPPFAESRALLAPFLADASIRKAGHDLKALMLLLDRDGMTLGGAEDDVELLSYLLNPSRKEHALSDLARERLRVELPSLPSGKKAPLRADLAPQELAPVLGAMADATRRMAPLLWKDLSDAGLSELARQLELPLIPILARVERAGVKVDLAALASIGRTVDAMCGEQVQAIYKAAGKEFPINSNAQLAQVLYVDLKLPVLKRGKTGPSTDQEVLEKLAQQHPVAQAIIDYRQTSKLKSTYLDTLPTLVASDGRIHTTFNQAATATGRLSSSDPNLQNIPIRSELGREIRKAFVAEEGHRLISADYSQIELRILAHIAQDPGLLEAFRNGEDVHTRTAAEIFEVPAASVDPNMRRVAKTVNFGIAYGLSPHGLSVRLDIPTDEAKRIIDRYFARYVGIRRYLDETVEKARRTGFVETLFGRRRLMGDLLSGNRNIAQAAERAAINMPIQGTAADLIKKAMLAVDKALADQKLATRLVLQVHDELLFEAPEAEVEEVIALARTCMSNVAEFDVPLVVEVGAGHSWSEAH